MINDDLIAKFYKITKMDLSVYFNNVLTFMQTDYQTIQQFYQGTVSTAPQASFNNFTSIQTQTLEIFQIFRKSGKQFNNIVWWDLLDQIELIDNRLKTLANINRWARSSAKTVGYSPAQNVDIILRQNGTLERVAQDVLGSTNPQDDWANIALDNLLAEEGYTADGGAKVTVTLNNKANSNFQINSVVDVISGYSVYGKDVSRHISFVDNDLNVLSYQDTILQAINILVTLKQNDNPDFPNTGLQTQLLVGQTQAALNFPVITRQLNATFATDDSLKNFTVTAIRYDQDNLYVDFTVTSRLGEVMSQSSIL